MFRDRWLNSHGSVFNLSLWREINEILHDRIGKSEHSFTSASDNIESLVRAFAEDYAESKLDAFIDDHFPDSSLNGKITGSIAVDPNDLPGVDGSCFYMSGGEFGYTPELSYAQKLKYKKT